MLGDPPAPVGQLLHVGQVPVLVEDGRERGNLLVEGEVRGAGEGVGHPALTALFEELVHLGAVGTAEVPEQLGREVAVPLGVESFGG